MKTPLILIIFTSLFLLLSCTKDETHVPRKYFAGSYEWQITESQNINGNSNGQLFTVSPNDEGHNYAITIKRSGKCFFYTDGELVSRGKISSIKKYVDYGELENPYRIEIDWESADDMSFEAAGNSVIINKTFPVDVYDSDNKFVKIID